MATFTLLYRGWSAHTMSQKVSAPDGAKPPERRCGLSGQTPFSHHRCCRGIMRFSYQAKIGMVSLALPLVALTLLAGNHQPVQAQADVADRSQHPAAWLATQALPADQAHQAAAADERFVYAINNSQVAKYDRFKGTLVALSEGSASHLNSGWIQGHQLFCAHSNYPTKPERSEIRAIDLDSMKMSTFKDFGESLLGSLTWAIQKDGDWWCNFAHYDDQNHKTVLVRYDSNWNLLNTYTYPPEVIADLGRYSLSGGVWHEATLLATGHDHRKLYCLRLPTSGNVLTLVGTVPAPFTGQGIAHDPVTGGLVGIDRARRLLIFASPAP